MVAVQCPGTWGINQGGRCEVHGRRWENACATHLPPVLDPFSTFGWDWRCSERVLQQAFSGHLCACHPGMSTWLLNCNNLPFYTQLYAKPLNFHTKESSNEKDLCIYIFTYIYICIIFPEPRYLQKVPDNSSTICTWSTLDRCLFSFQPFLPCTPSQDVLCWHCGIMWPLPAVAETSRISQY